MLTKGIVSYLRGVVPLFAVVLAMSPALTRAASATYDNPAYHNAGTGVDRLLSVSVSEYGWELAGHVSAAADDNGPSRVQSLVYTPDGGQESDDFVHLAWRPARPATAPSSTNSRTSSSSAVAPSSTLPGSASNSFPAGERGTCARMVR